MSRFKRLLISAGVASVAAGVLASGASAAGAQPKSLAGLLSAAGASPSSTQTVLTPAGVQSYALYLDFARVGVLTVNPSTGECRVVGLLAMSGECSAESTFTADLTLTKFKDISLITEDLAAGTGHLAYEGLGEIEESFTSEPEPTSFKIWVEVRRLI